MNLLAIIPARSGSKGIIDKNIKLLGPHPLIAHTIIAAQDSGIFSEVMVSTDSPHYAQIAKSYGASVPFLRSEKNSSDEAKSIDCVLEVLENYRALGKSFESIALLQPTSPLRDASDIKNAYTLFCQNDAQPLCSVHEVSINPLLIRKLESCHLTPIMSANSTQRRQDIGKFYKVNGAIYMHKTCELTPTTSLNDAPIGFEMEASHSIDIDTPTDWEAASALLTAGTK